MGNSESTPFGSTMIGIFLCTDDALSHTLAPPPTPKSSDFYRPQTKFAKLMFLHVSVSHSVHGGGGGWW